MVDNKMTFTIIANTIIEPGMSGGNRIFIESAKRWIKNGIKIQIFTSDVGRNLCHSNGLDNADFKIWKSPFKKEKFSGFKILLLYMFGVIRGSLVGLKTEFVEEKEIIYSSSDFWPDSIPAFIMKLRNPKIKWIVGFYLFAPKPWQRDLPYKGKRWVIGLFYWLTQLPIYWIVKRYADMVFVTSEPDVEKFITKKMDRDKIVVIRGGVDTKPSERYLGSNNTLPFEKKKYDVCFVGRFHYQKGVLELIDIWRFVCDKKRSVKLAIIGSGSLEKEVKEKIEKLGLQENIKLLGFKDGEEKYEIFKQSKIAVHPAIYDSGGMAACEAMAWGLPGVSFDLEALKTYYPKGMIKTPCFDLNVFAENIITLLEDRELYNRYREDAIAWAKEWDWDRRAEDILQQVRKVCL